MGTSLIISIGLWLLSYFLNPNELLDWAYTFFVVAIVALICGIVINIWEN